VAYFLGHPLDAPKEVSERVEFNASPDTISLLVILEGRINDDYTYVIASKNAKHENRDFKHDGWHKRRRYDHAFVRMG